MVNSLGSCTCTVENLRSAPPPLLLKERLAALVERVAGGICKTAYTRHEYNSWQTALLHEFWYTKVWDTNLVHEDLRHEFGTRSFGTRICYTKIRDTNLVHEDLGHEFGTRISGHESSYIKPGVAGSRGSLRWIDVLGAFSPSIHDR